MRVDGRRVRFTVSDTGPGIAPEDQERVFGRIAQVGDGFGGTGLGLPLPRSMAEMVGGATTRESTTDGGSRFTLTVPQRAPETSTVVLSR